MEVMIPPGYSHEDYSPSPRQIEAVSSARSRGVPYRYACESWD